MALSLPPLQQKRMGSCEVKKCSTSIRPFQDRAQQCCAHTKTEASSGGEAIVEAETEIAAESWEADGVLVLLVEEVGDASVNEMPPAMR